MNTSTHIASIRRFEEARCNLSHSALLSPIQIGRVASSNHWEEACDRYIAAVTAVAQEIDNQCGGPACAVPVVAKLRQCSFDSTPTSYLVHVTGAGRSVIVAGEYGAMWAWSISKSELGDLPHAFGFPPEPLRAAIAAAYGRDFFATPEAWGDERPMPQLPVELAGWQLGDLEDEVPADEDFELNVESLSDYFLPSFNDLDTGEPIKRTATVVRFDSWGRILHRFDGRPGEERPATEWGTKPRWVAAIVRTVGSALPEQIRVRANPAHPDVLLPRIRSASTGLPDAEAVVAYAYTLADRISNAREAVDGLYDDNRPQHEIRPHERDLILAQCEEAGILPLLRSYAGDGTLVWRHGEDESEPPAEGGATLEESWAVSDGDCRTWYPTLNQALCALLALAIEKGSLEDVAGDSVDLTPEGAQFGSRAWVNDRALPSVEVAP